MKCNHCSKELGEAKYCSECGKPVAHECPECKCEDLKVEELKQDNDSPVNINAVCSSCGFRWNL